MGVPSIGEIRRGPEAAGRAGHLCAGVSGFRTGRHVFFQAVRAPRGGGIAARHRNFLLCRSKKCWIGLLTTSSILSWPVLGATIY